MTAAATPDAVLREAVTATETCDLPDNDCGCYDADGDPKCDKCRRADITRKLESAAPILRRDLSARVAELEARWDNLIESVIGALRLDEDDVDTDLAREHPFETLCVIVNETADKALRVEQAEARGAALGKALDGLWAKVERWQKAHDALGGGDTPEERERILDEADSAESALLAARPDAATGGE